MDMIRKISQYIVQTDLSKIPSEVNEKAKHCIVGGKFGKVMGWSHYEAGWHGTGTIGTIASAVASAKALELTEEKTCHALAANFMSFLQF